MAGLLPAITSFSLFLFQDAANYTSRYGIRAQNDSYTELMISHFSSGVRAWAERSGALKSLEYKSVAANAVGIRSCR